MFKELPPPVRTSVIIYGYCLLGYNAYGAYVDATIYLKKYREGKLREFINNDYSFNKIKNDWDVVKFGAGVHFFERLWDSVIWPVKLITNVVPAIVLLLNPPPNTT